MGLNYQIGRKGESIARDFLESKGYRVIKSNYRCPLGEIDFICEDGKTTVLVEVNTRSHTHAGAPEEAVHFRKQQKLYRVAQWYLNEIKYRGERPLRFDVVSILTGVSNGEPSLKIFQNAITL